MRKSERGFSLVEVLIALAVLGIIAATFLTSLSVSGNSVIITDEGTTAESIARSQLEYIREQQYSEAQIGEEMVYARLDITGESPEYSIWSIDREGETVDMVLVGGEYISGVAAIPWDSENNIARTGDIGLQKITVVIKHGDKVVLTLETYKVKR